MIPAEKESRGDELRSFWATQGSVAVFQPKATAEAFQGRIRVICKKARKKVMREMNVGFLPPHEKDLEGFQYVVCRRGIGAEGQHPARTS